MNKKILSEVSPGELLDKISILEIKILHVVDENKKKKIKTEYNILEKIKNSSIEFTDEIKNLYLSLKDVNIVLWGIEDKIRVCEKNKDFGKVFIELARNVYFNNDDRARIKLEINNILKSEIVEIKQYTNYKK
jgi:hypothetical protein